MRDKLYTGLKDHVFKGHPYRFIDGKPNSSEPCAYCWSKYHRGYLSVHQLKAHECLRKKCFYLQKYEDHQYWKEKEKKKLDKKLKRCPAAENEIDEQAQ